MEEELETPTHSNTITTTTTSTTTDGGGGQFDNANNGVDESAASMFFDYIDSTCSTPFVSAPSSPGRGGPTVPGFYYSAPASPVHFVLASFSTPINLVAASSKSAIPADNNEFDFSARLDTNGSMSSADELFLNGQIRPMKLSAHLQQPQMLTPLLDLDPDNNEAHENEKEEVARGREMKLRDRSLRRRTRSMSPLRTTSFDQWHDDVEIYDKIEKSVVESAAADVSNESQTSELDGKTQNENETTPSDQSASSSRSSSVGRSSRRWVFLKEFLYRSKSEGRNNNHNKFWNALSFSPVKDKKLMNPAVAASSEEKTNKLATQESKKFKQSGKEQLNNNGKKAVAAVGGAVKVVGSNGGKRAVTSTSTSPSPSPHELHYTANRAQAEEMRKRTFLPYRQGLLGCLGFSSKSTYGAMSGFARALNPVSSR